MAASLYPLTHRLAVCPCSPDPVAVVSGSAGDVGIPRPSRAGSGLVCKTRRSPAVDTAYLS